MITLLIVEPVHFFFGCCILEFLVGKLDHDNRNRILSDTVDRT